ncbi:GNAT family N-acetyltransferase [Companilactobacillus allii]|uniref:GNAT family N-acetyltransferase n=1 Tax=Companilactobacillus allii TaxID=1847728 RepID=A0A1P8Q3E9_9LACO|nr:GNAT family N-acetyltransferase [Companilactobacillus allii]APX72373.1 GNAT family N-acetyltransferase [Companilactobacillus allii]USQ69466.1 GNAT family N-acetyltransferase [Companilactobacillus allii]
MSEQLILREAIPDDAEKLLEFLKLASKQSDFIKHDSLDEVTIDQEKNSLDIIYNSDDNELVVAIFDDEIIGFCRLENSDKEIAELGVVVDKDFWGNGIGSYLIEDALNWAKESSLKKVFLEVYKNNPVAIHIYHKYGFTTESEKHETLIMEKMV